MIFNVRFRPKADIVKASLRHGMRIIANRRKLASLAVGLGEHQSCHMRLISASTSYRHLIILLAAVALTARAQERLPTAEDEREAYCIPVLTSTITRTKQLIATLQDEKRRAYANPDGFITREARRLDSQSESQRLEAEIAQARESRKRVVASLRRIQTYFERRPPLDAASLNDARKSGAKDVFDIEAAFTKCNCLRLGRYARLDCIYECVPVPAEIQTRISSCLGG